jgi:hypothetical protein
MVMPILFLPGAAAHRETSKTGIDLGREAQSEQKAKILAAAEELTIGLE